MTTAYEYIEITEDIRLNTITVLIGDREYVYDIDEYCMTYDDRRVRISKITESFCLPNEVEWDLPYGCCVIHYLC